LARVARNVTPTTRRSFAVAAAARQRIAFFTITPSLVLTIAADIVQDLYLRELRAYKPPPGKPSDAEGHVQKFKMPTAPKSPEETSLANQVNEYESSAVEVEGQTSTGETQEPEGDYFEDMKVFDEEQPAAH
jgi:F-type H+-transporting ATPase subunit h